MADLIIENETNEVEYSIGSTAQTGPFAFPFPIFKNADLKVVWNDGTSTITLVEGVDYTITLLAAVTGGYTDGEITLSAGKSNGTLKLYRDTVIERLTSFPTSGPFDIAKLNLDLNKAFAILIELNTVDAKHISLPEEAINTDPWDADSRKLQNLAEDTAQSSAATLRQANASGPTNLQDSDAVSGPLTIDQWNTVASASNVPIYGEESTKTFDLVVQWFSFIQNRGGNNAEFYVRTRYTVKTYAEIAKIQSSDYRCRVGLTSALPFHFMDIAQAIDYTNGDELSQVAIDIYPLGADASNLYYEWSNLLINTARPIS